MNANRTLPIAGAAVLLVATVVAAAVMAGNDTAAGDSPSPSPIVTPAPTGSPALPAPTFVQLVTATGNDVRVDIVDPSGLVIGATSGTPGDGASVEPYRLIVENVDARTLRLTWVDYPIDNELTLLVDPNGNGLRLVLVQPEPSGPTDAIGFDRVLVLTFDTPIAATDVETFLQDGLDS